MDLARMIAIMRAERERLDSIIAALERLHTEANFSTSPKRRGRKSMDKKGRDEVSERMKRYWAERRKRAEGSKPPKTWMRAIAERTLRRYSSNRTPPEWHGHIPGTRRARFRMLY